MAVAEGIPALERLYDKAAKARKPFDVEWLLDCAFYVGLQYTEWHTPKNGRDGQFRTIPRDPKRPSAPRPIANKIYPLVMDAFAAVSSHAPDVEVLPTNGDAMQISDAKVAQAYLDHITFPTQANWEMRRNAAWFWLALCGEGWLKWVMSEPKGRPDIEACSPLEIYGDPSPDNYLDWRWLIHARAMDPDDVYDRYGVDLPASAVDPQDQQRQTILREIGMASGSPTVTVKELWELPSRRHPEGRFITWAGGQYLTPQGAPFPYAHKQLPFTQLGHSPIPGTSHYCSGTRSARPLQMELNQYHAQKTDARKKFANHKWFIDSVLHESMTQMPDDSPDQVLVGDSRNGQSKPEILQAQMWPDSQDGVWINDELQDAVGLHEASTGQAPGRVDSAQGIEQLQEADEGRLRWARATMDTAIARGFGQLLELAKQYVKAEQIIPDYTSKGVPAVMRFKTSRFPEQPILRVVSGGGLPKNRAARRAEIISMWTAGLLGPNPRKALELLDMPRDMNLAGDEMDVLEAEQENMLMLQGVAVTPHPWQNHEAHRRVHDECRKSAEFMSSPDKVWGVFDFHDQRTDMAELEDIQQEAKRQAAITAIAESAVPPDAPVPTAPTAAQPEGQAPQQGAVPA